MQAALQLPTGGAAAPPSSPSKLRVQAAEFTPRQPPPLAPLPGQQPAVAADQLAALASALVAAPAAAEEQPALGQQDQLATLQAALGARPAGLAASPGLANLLQQPAEEGATSAGTAGTAPTAQQQQAQHQPYLSWLPGMRPQELAAARQAADTARVGQAGPNASSSRSVPGTGFGWHGADSADHAMVQASLAQEGTTEVGGGWEADGWSGGGWDDDAELPALMDADEPPPLLEDDFGFPLLAEWQAGADAGSEWAGGLAPSWSQALFPALERPPPAGEGAWAVGVSVGFEKFAQVSGCGFPMIAGCKRCSPL